jgi:Cys-rich four helix bundle protein (predicted Tat secretion target)
MNRRDALVAGAAGALLLARGAAAQPKAKAPDPRAALLESLARCIRTGESCVAHCADELGKGNKEMAECNRRAQEMLAVVRATLTLATLDSPLFPAQAALCANACKVCADACAAHKAHFAHGMHQPCKDCLDACLDCEKRCRSFAK